MADFTKSAIIGEYFDYIINILISHKKEALHIFRSIDRTTFDRLLMNTIERFVTKHIHSVLSEVHIMLQPRLISVEPFSESKLLLYYETGEQKVFDVSPYMTGAWYEMLKNLKYFGTVHLLPGGVGIEWQDGHDIAPHELYELSTVVNS